MNYLDPKPVSEFKLIDFIEQMRTDDLDQMMKWLEIPRPRPTKKVDKARVIRKRLTKSYLLQLWKDLSSIEQIAVREVIHSADDEFNFVKFRARYQSMPKFVQNEYREHLVLPLRFFFYVPDRNYSSVVIPAEIKEILNDVATPPPEVAVPYADEIPEVIPRPVNRYEFEDAETRMIELKQCETEYAAVHDLNAVLRLVDLGRVTVSASTQRATAASIRKISDELFGGDYFEPEKKEKKWHQAVGPIRAFAWPLLLQAGKLAERRGSKLVLTKAGKSALSSAAEDTLRSLWQKWVKNKLLDEFNRIDEIKGQIRGKGRRTMSATAPRRMTIAENICECPVGKWIPFDEFSQFMLANGAEFDITRNPWNLYLASPDYGRLGYDHIDGWTIFQERYMMCLIFEYMSTLGIVDVAYTHPHHAKLDFTDCWGADEMSWLSQYDGLEYFRLTALGAYCLGITENYESRTAVECTPISVFPDLRLRAQRPLSKTEQLTLETFANLEAEGVWRLARDKILSALDKGHDIAGLREFLAKRDEQPLPETAEGLLREIERNANALKDLGSAYVFECASEEIATHLANDKRTSNLCQLVGSKQLVVLSKKDSKFRKAVHSLGYGLPQP